MHFRATDVTSPLTNLRENARTTFNCAMTSVRYLGGLSRGLLRGWTGRAMARGMGMGMGLGIGMGVGMSTFVYQRGV